MVIYALLRLAALQAQAFTYDAEDRLLSTSNGVTIVYDGDGNRVSENTTKYLVDDQTPTGYAQVAEELVSGAVTAQFTYGPMRISQRRTATSFYSYDAGGSVRQLTDNIGTVTDTYAYDAFGNTVAQSGPTVNEFQYRGEQYDASLQMYYLRARYYRPLIGRFLTGDTYEGRALDPASRHRYAYTSADPANGEDPSGHANLITWSARVGIISELAVGAKQAGLAARGLASLGEFAQPELDRIAEEAVFLLEQRGAMIEEGVEWFVPQPGRVTAAVSQLLDPRTGRVIQAVSLRIQCSMFPLGPPGDLETPCHRRKSA